MTIIHTPRTIVSVVKGLRQHASSSEGLGFLTPHKYTARVGLFDVDYLGHMNNAAFLSHAEYARWEMTGASGLLQAVYRHRASFIVTAVACRYRAEVRPLFRRFEIQTRVVGLNDKHVWLYQTFRYPEEGEDRLRAQVLVKGVMAKKKIIEPGPFLRDHVGVRQEVLDSIQGGGENMLSEDELASMDQAMDHFSKVEDSFRDAAALDDELRQS